MKKVQEKHFINFSLLGGSKSLLQESRVQVLAQDRIIISSLYSKTPHSVTAVVASQPTNKLDLGSYHIGCWTFLDVQLSWIMISSVLN